MKSIGIIEFMFVPLFTCTSAYRILDVYDESWTEQLYSYAYATPPTKTRHKCVLQRHVNHITHYGQPHSLTLNMHCRTLCNKSKESVLIYFICFQFISLPIVK